MNLFVGAHPDDIEMMCGGTIMKLKERGEEVTFLVFTDGSGRNGNRLKEQRESLSFLEVNGHIMSMRDRFIQVNGNTMEAVDEHIDRLKPDRVFVHHPQDHHQDHRAVSQLVTTANRHKLFDLFYYDTVDVTNPIPANMFVDITDCYPKKLELLRIFNSQQDRWYMHKEEVGFGTPFARYVERFEVKFMKDFI